MGISLLPTMALATNATSVWVGGVELTDTDVPVYATIRDNTIAIEGADETNYNVKFEVVENVSTLTLQNFAYTGSGYKVAGIYADGDLSIVLEDANGVTRGGVKSRNSYGIYRSGALNISGSGSLTTNGGEANECSYGIYSSDFISISDGTVTATGGAATTGFGIYVDQGSLIINGIANVTASGAVSALNTIPTAETNTNIKAGTSSEHHKYSGNTFRPKFDYCH